MIDKNATPKPSPFHGLPPDILNGIDVKLTVLEVQLTQHAENECHYPEIAKVFNGLRKYVSAVRDTINRKEAIAESDEDGNATKSEGQPAKKVPSIVTALLGWLSAAPPEFPDFMDGSTAKSLFKNAFIGEERDDTFRAVHDSLSFLKEMVLPDDSKEGVSLDNNAAWGLFRYLENIEQAIAFELEHRPNGGVSTGNYYMQDQ